MRHYVFLSPLTDSECISECINKPFLSNTNRLMHWSNLCVLCDGCACYFSALSECLIRETTTFWFRCRCALDLGRRGGCGSEETSSGWWEQPGRGRSQEPQAEPARSEDSSERNVCETQEPKFWGVNDCCARNLKKIRPGGDSELLPVKIKQNLEAGGCSWNYWRFFTGELRWVALAYLVDESLVAYPAREI